MAWREFYSARPRCQYANRYFRRDEFLASPDHAFELVRTACRPIFFPFPYIQAFADVQGLLDSSVVQVQVATPLVHLGGFAHGLQQFMMEVTEFPLGFPTSPCRGPFDQNGKKCENQFVLRYPKFRSFVPSSGILDWNLKTIGCTKWPPGTWPVGMHGIICWVTQIWVWE